MYTKVEKEIILEARRIIKEKHLSGKQNVEAAIALLNSSEKLPDHVLYDGLEYLQNSDDFRQKNDLLDDVNLYSLSASELEDLADNVWYQEEIRGDRKELIDILKRSV